MFAMLQSQILYGFVCFKAFIVVYINNIDFFQEPKHCSKAREGEPFRKPD